jgi:transposase
VVTKAAQPGSALPVLPSRRRDVRLACLAAPSRPTHPTSRPPHFTYAEGPPADEPSGASRPVGHHRPPGAGQLILRAIVAGERDPKTLAAFRQANCKADEATLIKALTGNWRDEHLFALQQSLALFDAYTDQLAACDTEIERRFAVVKPRWDAPDDLPPLPPVKANSKSKNKPAQSTRQELFRITGVDLVAVDGISAGLAQVILTEVGTDMSRWFSVKHFASWLGLAPHNDISGGKVLRSRTLKTDNRAGQAFKQAAASVIRSHSAYGAFYRRKRAQLGPAQALVATAHRIARTVYFLLKYKTAYHDLGADGYETQQRERELAALKRRAAKLGFDLTVKEAA